VLDKSIFRGCVLIVVDVCPNIPFLIRFFEKNWCKKGVIIINDLMERDGGFMTLEGFNNKYNFNVNFIDVHGLINTLPRDKSIFRGCVLIVVDVCPNIPFLIK
jgi:hypothetical protein